MSAMTEARLAKIDKLVSDYNKLGGNAAHELISEVLRLREVR